MHHIQEKYIDSCESVLIVMKCVLKSKFISHYLLIICHYLLIHLVGDGYQDPFGSFCGQRGEILLFPVWELSNFSPNKS